MKADSKTSEERGLPLLISVLGPLAVFGSMLIRGESLFWGAPLTQFTPWRVAALRILRNGELPLWNPWLGMGAPLLANYQSALLYPPNLILLLLDPSWGATLLVMAHLIWAGIGMVLLTRSMRFGSLAQAIAAAAFSLSSYLVARSGFLSINAAASWLPWIVLAAERMCSATRAPTNARRIGRQALLLSATLAMQWLAGHAQMAWYSLVLTAGWLVWRSLEHRRWRTLLRAAAAFLGAGALGFAMASAQLLPTIEYLLQSSRVGGLDEHFALSYSFWPWRISGLLAPDLFGNPATGDYWGFANYWEDALYIGTLPFLLAIGGAVAGRVSRKKLRGFLVIASTLAFVLALGRNTPIFPFLFRNLPTFDLFQAPTRWNLILVFSLALLAAIGAEAWQKASGRALYWLRLGTAGALGIAVTASASSRLLADLEPSFAPAITAAGISLAIAGCLALLRKDHPGWMWSRGVLALMLIDLALVGWDLNPSAPASLQSGRSALADSIDGDYRLHMSSELQDRLMFGRFFTFDRYHPDFEWELVREAGLPNVVLLDGIFSANNFDPMLSRRYERLMEALERTEPDRRTDLMAWMDIGWRATGSAGSSAGVEYLPLKDPSRIHLVPSARWAEDEGDAFSTWMDPGFDPWEEVILEGDPPAAARHGGQGQAALRSDSGANTIAITVRAEQGSWLVLADAWYPGWLATLDGQRTSLYIANTLFRAVWVPPGEHTVEFHYRPASLRYGVVLSLVGCSLALILRWRWREEK